MAANKNNKYGEPLKKKKKVDPAIVKMQQERKRKRLEKQIKKAKRVGRKYKPVDEMELDRLVAKDAPARSSLHSDTNIQVQEELAQQANTLLEWRHYRNEQTKSIHIKFADMLASQEKALSQLKLVSPSLYQQAVQIDEDLIPFTYTGPVETPPKPNYMQDGGYTETTKSYEMDPEIIQVMLDKGKN